MGYIGGNIGIMENKMETTIMGYMGVIFWWLNLVRLFSLYKILYPKGGYSLTLYWVP